MPQFAPSETKTAKAPITVQPSGLSCTAELYLVSDSAKVATSGIKSFTSTGAKQDITLPVTMPGAEGRYPVWLDVYAGGMLVGAFIATEDVIIAPVGLLLNPSFETGSLSPWVFWTNYGGRCSARVSAEAAYEGLYSARFSASTGLTRYIIGMLTQIIDWHDEYRGKTFTFGAMAKAAPKNNLSIQIDDGVGVSSSPVHSGSNQFEALLATRVIAANANKLAVVLHFAPDPSLGTKARAYFDATSLE